MAETIRLITEYNGKRAGGWGTEAGYQIHTTEQTITLAIDDEPCCCESWGYFLSEDDLEKFVGAELRGVTITDTNRTGRKFTTEWNDPDDDQHIHIDSGDTLFVDIETDRGVLQFAAYNAHNGYYGHEARVQSTQLKHEVYL